MCEEICRFRRVFCFLCFLLVCLFERSFPFRKKQSCFWKKLGHNREKFGHFGSFSAMELAACYVDANTVQQCPSFVTVLGKPKHSLGRFHTNTKMSTCARKENQRYLIEIIRVGQRIVLRKTRLESAFAQLFRAVKVSKCNAMQYNTICVVDYSYVCRSFCQTILYGSLSSAGSNCWSTGSVAAWAGTSQHFEKQIPFTGRNLAFLGINLVILEEWFGISGKNGRLEGTLYSRTDVSSRSGLCLSTWA